MEETVFYLHLKDTLPKNKNFCKNKPFVPISLAESMKKS